MGVTRFPNGIEVGDGSAASTLSVGGTTLHPVGASSDGYRVGALAGTVITGAGTIGPSAFGLTAVVAAVVSFAGTATTWGGTASGGPEFVKAYVSGGSVVVRCFDSAFAAAVNAGTVAIVAHGT